MGVSQDTLLPSGQYANPVTPTTLKIGVFSVVGNLNLSLGKMTMSNLINFNFENNQVRTALKGNEPYFCLSDVTNILAVNRRSSEAFNLDENGIIKLDTPTKGGTQQITFISEPNLYRVIFRSNKAQAVKFQNWVFDDVLPSIRKTGQYRHTISETQAYELKRAVELKCKHNSLHYQTLWTALKNEFKCPTYRELLASDFDEAMAFITAFGFDNNALSDNAFIMHAIADQRHQIKKAQQDITLAMSYFGGMIEQLGSLQRRLDRQSKLMDIISPR